MKIDKNLILYHGSYTEVKTVDLRKCAPNKDFGQGFYLTSDREQAIKFVHSSVRKAVKNETLSSYQSYGYVSVFRLTEDCEEIPYYGFEAANREWLWYVSQNRRKDLIPFLENRFDEELKRAEIISGKVANDTTNPVIVNYASGVFGPVEDERVIQAVTMLLLPDKLKDQYCFKSERAVACLQFLESIRYEC